MAQESFSLSCRVLVEACSAARKLSKSCSRASSISWERSLRLEAASASIRPSRTSLPLDHVGQERVGLSLEIRGRVGLVRVVLDQLLESCDLPGGLRGRELQQILSKLGSRVRMNPWIAPWAESRRTRQVCAWAITSLL